MLKAVLIAVGLVLPLAATAQAQEEWCTDQHMTEMDAQIAKMTDADKKKEAQAHLQMSKDAMKAGDTEGCIKHMKAAHAAMGL